MSRLARVKDELAFLRNRLLPKEGSNRLLVVGAGFRAFRGYVLQDLHALGYPITLLLGHPPSWEKRCVDEIVVVPELDPTEVLERLQPSLRARPVAGVFTFIEQCVPLAAKLSLALGLPLYGPEVAERARDKHRMREVFRTAGMRVPRFAPVHHGDLDAAIAQVGLPAVLKPSRGEGSVHVRKLTSAEDLEGARALVSERKDSAWAYGDYLVESYLEGPEYSVESVVADGRIHHVGITEKRKSAEPWFEEIGHTSPAPLDAHVQREILAEATRAIEALGLRACAVHTELKLTAEGPVIIEVGGRLGGDLIPRITRLATGIDLVQATAEAALGRAVTVEPWVRQFVSVGFFVPAKAQHLPRALERTPTIDGLQDFGFWGTKGEALEVPPVRFMTRLGYCICVGPTAEASRERVDAVRREVERQTGAVLEPLA